MLLDTWACVVAGSQAPVNVQWGYDNRTCGIRIPNSNAAARSSIDSIGTLKKIFDSCFKLRIASKCGAKVEARSTEIASSNLPAQRQTRSVNLRPTTIRAAWSKISPTFSAGIDK
jgi:hypothetical protein